MQHAEITGTFLGHVVAGVIVLGWGIWWLARTMAAIARRPAAAAAAAAADGRLVAAEGADGWNVTTAFTRSESWLKIGIPMLAGLGDLWWAGWRMTDSSVLNYQHASAYAGFVLAGVSDQLARRGRIPASVPHVVLAGAFAVAAFQFMAHGGHAAVSDAVHRFVIALLLAETLVVLLELGWRHPAPAIVRAWILLVLGTWFLHIAWILYRSGWDLTLPANVMRAHLFFTWHVMAATVVLYPAWVLARRAAGAAAAEVDRASA